MSWNPFAKIGMFFKEFVAGVASFFIGKPGKTAEEGINSRWVRVTMDKLYFESQINRYFIILKTDEGEKSKSIFIALDTMEDLVLNALVSKNNVMNKILGQLQIKPLRIRILQKENTLHSALCIIKAGWSNRIIKLSTLEAIQISHEFNIPMEVSKNVMKASRIDIGHSGSQKMKNNLFSYKFNGDDAYNNNEVVM